MTLFDAYLMVDWSASSRPKGGKDSIWFCFAVWEREDLSLKRLENPRSRSEALEHVTAIARDCLEAGRRLLVGFDFPFGYPAGLAAKLGLHGVPWRVMWRELAALVQDDVDGKSNRNNRFEVAAGLNKRISGRRGPFWGCPASKASALLSTRRVDSDPCRLDPFRECDRAIRGPQSIYKLFTTGSVGSQALMGIPRLEKLRSDFGSACRVWPFETGLRAPEESARVVLAEIYPSMFPIGQAYPFGVKDAGQVQACVYELAMADRDQHLGRLFAGSSEADVEQRQRIEREEGWILGIG